MLLPATLIAALLLAIERVAYILVWHHPDAFERLCSQGRIFGIRDPVNALNGLFAGFKFIQIGVFVAWWALFDGRFPPLPTAPTGLLMAGIALFLAGQVLNFSVFWRLGRTGVFYGNRLGHRVPRVTGFPFSIVPHPQYTGTLVSIWGLFLIMRYPNPDWVVLPLLETVYYLAAMRLERHLDGRADAPETPQP
jgi:methylene-fatty-acyl-phospholipid synthase